MLLFLSLVVALSAFKPLDFNASQYIKPLDDSYSLPFSLNGIYVGTWNVGLFPWENVQSTIDNIPQLYEVIALQEVWSESAANQIISAMKTYYPFSFYAPAAQRKDIGCAPVLPEEVCAYLNIPGTNCVPIIAGALLQCLISIGLPLDRIDSDEVFASPCASYAGALLFVDNMCPVCLLNEAYETNGNPDLTLANCLAQQGSRFAYGGSVGQLILSKLPIENPTVFDFPSYGARRANIYATIFGLKFAFSHYPYDILADAGLTGVVPPLPGALQPVLAQAMIDSGSDVLVGDFNSGSLYQSEAYNLISQSYTDLAPNVFTYCTQPMIDAKDPRCVFGEFSRLPLAIDHIFLSNKWQMVFDGYDTFGDTSGLSDHAGLQAHGLLWSCSSQKMVPLASLKKF